MGTHHGQKMAPFSATSPLTFKVKELEAEVAVLKESYRDMLERTEHTHRNDEAAIDSLQNEITRLRNQRNDLCDWIKRIGLEKDAEIAALKEERDQVTDRLREVHALCEGLKGLHNRAFEAMSRCDVAIMSHHKGWFGENPTLVEAMDAAMGAITRVRDRCVIAKGGGGAGP